MENDFTAIPIRKTTKTYLDENMPKTTYDEFVKYLIEGYIRRGKKYPKQ